MRKGRVVAPFVVGVVNSAAAGVDTEQALRDAAEASGGPGADELRGAVSHGALGLQKLAENWDSPALASVVVAIRTGDFRSEIRPYLLAIAASEAAAPSARAQLAAQFVAAYLDAQSQGEGPHGSLETAKRYLRGPGFDGPDLEELMVATADWGTIKDGADSIAELGRRWDCYLLIALATSLRGSGPGPATRAYLVSGVEAVGRGQYPSPPATG